MQLFFSGSHHQCVRRWRTKHTSPVGNQQSLRQQLNPWRSQGLHSGRSSQEDFGLLSVYGTRMLVYWDRGWSYLCAWFDIFWTQRPCYLPRYCNAKVLRCTMFLINLKIWKTQFRNKKGKWSLEENSLKFTIHLDFFFMNFLWIFPKKKIKKNTFGYFWKH